MFDYLLRLLPVILISAAGTINAVDKNGQPVKLVAQRVKRGKGNSVLLGSKYQLQIRRELPRNDAKSPAQLARRQRFMDVVTAWGELTDDERQQWRQRGRALKRTGRNLFISEHMRQSAI